MTFWNHLHLHCCNVANELSECVGRAYAFSIKKTCGLSAADAFSREMPHLDELTRGSPQLSPFQSYKSPLPWAPVILQWQMFVFHVCSSFLCFQPVLKRKQISADCVEAPRFHFNGHTFASLWNSLKRCQENLAAAGNHLINEAEQVRFGPGIFWSLDRWS